MTLIDEREVMFEQERKQKIIKNIIKIIAILVFIVIVLLVYISTKDAGKLKVLVDGNEQSNLDSQLILKNEKGKILEENGDIYISVQKLATMLNYEYYNSEYKKKGEDKTKCQVRIQNEYTSYIANSNKMYKTIVMVTHDPQMASWCDRIVLLKDGRIINELKKKIDQSDFYRVIIESMVEL